MLGLGEVGWKLKDLLVQSGVPVKTYWGLVYRDSSRVWLTIIQRRGTLELATGLGF